MTGDAPVTQQQSERLLRETAHTRQKYTRRLHERGECLRHFAEY